MKGDAKLIEALNEILSRELTAINQYFIHAKMCGDWGYERLGDKVRKESFGEMRHADELIERILHLGGVPSMQRLEKVKIGEKVPEQFKLDLEMELDAIARLNKAIALAAEVGDNYTRDLLERMLHDEDHHAHWLESQLELIKQVGEQNYLSQQIHQESK
jgi:bacterioferritin